MDGEFTQLLCPALGATPDSINRGILFVIADRWADTYTEACALLDDARATVLAESPRYTQESIRYHEPKPDADQQYFHGWRALVIGYTPMKRGA
jgi:hypothetical protein